MKTIAISTSSFGQIDSKPLEMLKQYGFEVRMNPHGRKIIENEIIELCENAVGLIAGTEILNKEVLSKLPDLKIISRCGVGIENVDSNALNKHSIRLFNTPFGPTLPVAELTVGLILNLLRQVSIMDRDMRSGIWEKRMGNLLRGKKIGIIGLGRIGQCVAKLLLPFGTEIAYTDCIDVCETSGPLDYQRMELIDLISWADILTLHCPLSVDGKKTLGKEEIAQIKPGAFLINASRGGLIDEPALYEALSSGHLAGAAIDGFEDEPYNGPLLNLDNILLTPHIGSYAKEARVEMEVMSVDNLITGLEQEGLL